MYAEMLKAEEQEMPKLLQHILQDIWDTEVIPMLGRGVKSSNSQRKGIGPSVTTGEASHYCPSPARFSAASFSNASQQQWTNHYAKNRQASGRGKSCIDHIIVLRQILEQSHEWNSSMYVVFVDIEKALDNPHRPYLRKILRHHGIPQKLVNINQSLYENFECRCAPSGHHIPPLPHPLTARPVIITAHAM